MNKNKKMFYLIIFGPPGSGKGTHSKKIVEKYDFVHISTGDIFRSEMAKDTDLGKLAKKYIDKGKLVPDNVVLKMLFSNIAMYENPKGFVLDGFPRTIEQAEKLDETILNKTLNTTLVISLDVADDELIARLLKRGEDSHRSDDNEEIIRQRLEVYKQQTKPLLDHYKQKKVLKSINGIGKIDDIFADICKIIDSHKK